MNKWVSELKSFYDVCRGLAKNEFDAEFIKSLRFSKQSWKALSYIHIEGCLACVTSTWLLTCLTSIPSAGLYHPSPLLSHIILFCFRGEFSSFVYRDTTSYSFMKEGRKEGRKGGREGRRKEGREEGREGGREGEGREGRRKGGREGRKERKRGAYCLPTPPPHLATLCPALPPYVSFALI